MQQRVLLAGQLALVALTIHLATNSAACADPASDDLWATVTEDERAIKIDTAELAAVIPKRDPKQWMTGLANHSFVDKATGFHEVGDGLMVVDWLMEAGSDAEWSEQVFTPDGNGVGRYSWFENETDPARRAGGRHAVHAAEHPGDALSCPGH